eukprot:gene4281-4535_t
MAGELCVNEEAEDHQATEMITRCCTSVALLIARNGVLQHIQHLADTLTDIIWSGHLGSREGRQQPPQAADLALADLEDVAQLQQMLSVPSYHHQLLAAVGVPEELDVYELLGLALTAVEISSLRAQRPYMLQGLMARLNMLLACDTHNLLGVQQQHLTEQLLPAMLQYLLPAVEAAQCALYQAEDWQSRFQEHQLIKELAQLLQAIAGRHCLPVSSKAAEVDQVVWTAAGQSQKTAPRAIGIVARVGRD